jgi:cytochrome c biogenesis protein
LSHYAVFLIALGAIMGSLPGLSLDQQVDIQEGDTHQAADGSLPFDIRVDKFHAARQTGTETVENYYSDVALLSQGQEVARAQISVNKPLRYQGYFISQASWSLGEARIEVTRNGKTTPLAFPLARTGYPDMGSDSCWGVPQEDAAAFMPDGRTAIVATGFFADAVQEGKKMVGTGSEYPGRPALDITYVSGLPQKRLA